ncbi:MAG TPA: hypothetical protein VL337_10600 [Acidimicrobiales bacterium]|nr:hypothetical protein [Acidimicrobiales bacterium]
MGWVQKNRVLSIAGGLAFVLVLLAAPVLVLAQDGPSGFLEICKQADAPSVTGSFVFLVAGRSVSVPVGACSPAIELPAGQATVTEVEVEGVSVTEIRTSPPERLLSRDLPTRSALVSIAAGDISSQTTLTFTNHSDVSVLKICKVAGSGVAVGSTFTFAVGASAVPVTAGPAPGGYCTVAGSFPVASNVVVSEVVPRGVEVAAISVAPGSRLVGTANTAGASVVVRIGTGVTEAVFTNQASPPTPVAPTTTLPLSGVSPTTQPPLAATTTVPPAAASPTTLPPAAVAPTTTTTRPCTSGASTTTAPTGSASSTIPCTTALPTTVPPGLAPTTTVGPSGLVPTTVPPGAAATTTTLPCSSGAPTTVPSPTTTTTAAGSVPTTTLPCSTPLPTTLPPALPTTLPVTTAPPAATTSSSTSVPGSGPVPAPTTTVPPSPVLFGPGPPAPFTRLTQTPPLDTRLAHTGTDPRGLLWAGLALLALGGACVAIGRCRRPVATLPGADDFPALTFEPVVRPAGPVPYDRGRTVGQRVRARLSASPFARTSSPARASAPVSRARASTPTAAPGARPVATPSAWHAATRARSYSASSRWRLASISGEITGALRYPSSRA